MSKPVEPVIRFENVSKRFLFTPDKPRSFLESLLSLASRAPKDAPSEQDLWVLHNVSFDVKPGQGFGIIGRNGSGKSTTLKLIARILQPNDGRITIRGRVSALLELGAGFHPDLTGRENIFLNAAVLGLQEDEIKARFDDIVAFSELAQFIDMPVKHYSSGMYMRLGFSVAIHVQPDILIVDEILAVGDQAFQTKCLNAILDMKMRGTTILMVSHNLHQLRTICSELVWIENGEMVAKGSTESVIAKYVEFSHAREGKRLETKFERLGDQVVELTAVRILNKAGEAQEIFRTGDDLTIEMHYTAHKPIPNPEFGLAIYREDGTHINGPNTELAGLDLGTVEGEGTVRYKISNLPLLPATYRVTTAVHDSRVPHCYDLHKEAYSFRVIPGGAAELYGVVQLPAQWEATKAHAKPEDAALA